MITFLRLAAVLCALAVSSTASAASQDRLDRLAQGLGVEVTILDNRPRACPQKKQNCFLSELKLRIPDDAPVLGPEDFHLYFSFVRPLIEAANPRFKVRHINGDLHLLELRPGTRLRAGETYRIPIWAEGQFFSSYFVMPNMYFADEGLQPRIIEATRPRTDPESGLEILPFVSPMTNEAKLGTAGATDQTRWLTPERAFALNRERRSAAAQPASVIIPTPKLVQPLAGAALDVRKGVDLRLSGIDQATIAPALQGLARAGVAGWSSGPHLWVDVAASFGLPPEGYRLATSDGGIRIEAADPAGAAHALRSLEQQVKFEGGLLRPLRIEDAPRFAFRGLHLDLARNFHGKAEILKLIEQMGAYKLNRLHLHLADDEGWRLEVKALPELTEVGAYRCHDPAEDRCLLPQLGAGPNRQSPVNGFLSQDDYREILQFAKARHIEVIPSLDMPGHSRAAIRSMEARYRRLMAAGEAAEAKRFRLVEPEDRTRYRSIQYYDDNTLNVCIDSTYRFLDLVLDELVALHASAGAPLKTYHIGADETAGAWSQSPACKRVMARTGRTAPQLGAMFIERVSNSLAQRGIKVGGWSDGLSHVDPRRMPAQVHSNIWSDLLTAAPAEAHRHANRGWDAVISVPNILYFDIPYAPHPLERGYDWPSRGTDTFKVFSFIPENLPANASVMRDKLGKGVRSTDKVPLASGRRFTGIQAQLWSETVRSDAQVDYMLFPRLLAFAERAWHRADWEPAYRPRASYAFGDGRVDRAALLSDWQRFSAKLPAHLERLDAVGIHYRLSPPGARIVAGQLEANSEHPGVRIEYRSGSGAWVPYVGPTAVNGPVELRTRSADGQRTSRIVEVGR